MSAREHTTTCDREGPERRLVLAAARAWREEFCSPGPSTTRLESGGAGPLLSAKVGKGDANRIKVTTETGDLADSDLVVEVVEELGPKVDLLKAVGDAAGEADLASTTSSLSLDDSVPRAAVPSGSSGCAYLQSGLKMDLVRLCLPTRPGTSDPPACPGLVQAIREDRRRGPQRARGSSSTGCSSPTCSTPCA